MGKRKPRLSPSMDFMVSVFPLWLISNYQCDVPGGRVGKTSTGVHRADNININILKSITIVNYNKIIRN